MSGKKSKQNKYATQSHSHISLPPSLLIYIDAKPFATGSQLLGGG